MDEPLPINRVDKKICLKIDFSLTYLIKGQKYVLFLNLKMIFIRIILTKVNQYQIILKTKKY